MKLTVSSVLALLATSAFAAPRPQQGTACTSAVTLDPSVNPFSSRSLWANPYYAAEVKTAVAAISDSSLAAKAAKVADIGSFLWFDTISKIAVNAPLLENVPCDKIAGLVIYDLPGRDCAAKASNGELPVGSINRYKSEYIDPIRELLLKHKNTAFVLVIEPDSLPNLVTNINLTTCQQSKAGYEEGVAYALKQLNLPNVIMYLDAGHGGWLGWNDNVKPGAEGIAKVYKAAGSPKQVRGVASNVAGWNAFSKTPGEFENSPDGKYNSAHDEKRYAALFGAALVSAGMPGKFIVDTSRSGVQGLRLEWGHWCNVKGAGFGPRPTGSTGDSNVDGFVWVKPGGESDGTSDTSAVRYDSFCGNSDAYKPSPEAGQWNQAYFEDLVKNANPAL
jgi:cellulose 1,4-beta-cellobiosidase